MIPKKPAPDPIRGDYRFSEKIMLKQNFRPALSSAGRLAFGTAAVPVLSDQELV
jgi:hypothetical protein